MLTGISLTFCSGGILVEDELHDVLGGRLGNEDELHDLPGGLGDEVHIVAD